MTDSLPLVSIVVMSYNSAGTIGETLSSIERQGYRKFEILFCDDGSTDATQQMIGRWTDDHRDEYTIGLHLSECNEGVVRNVAKGYAAAQGDWIKLIAADDLLADDCLERFVEEAGRQRADLIFSQCMTFNAHDEHQRIVGWSSRINAGMPREQMLSLLLRKNLFPAPSSFISKSALVAAGGPDLRFRMLDDWPLWIRMMAQGARVGLIERPLVHYRISSESVSSSAGRFVSMMLWNDLKQLYLIYQAPAFSRLERLHRRLEIWLTDLNIVLFGNRRRTGRLLRKLLILSPFYYVSRSVEPDDT
jgi:alpha-1,3-rhamnosyltransferase